MVCASSVLELREELSELVTQNSLRHMLSWRTFSNRLSEQIAAYSGWENVDRMAFKVNCATILTKPTFESHLLKPAASQYTLAKH